MLQIKKTKIELKSRRDALRRFERFLPMLQLKKQQLRMEMQSVLHAMEKNRGEGAALLDAARSWTALFPEAESRLASLVVVERVHLSDANIAGVTIPVCESVDFHNPELDLFETAPWLDEAQELIMKLVVLRIQRAFLERQHELLAEEFRTTSQRVNLFEKVKIPESREIIRVIKIFLGDQMTAEVARGKSAKKMSRKGDAA
ncbi:MAG: V-type ATP synthase subunit D [bacterium]